MQVNFLDKLFLRFHENKKYDRFFWKEPVMSVVIGMSTYRLPISGSTIAHLSMNLPQQENPRLLICSRTGA